MDRFSDVGIPSEQPDKVTRTRTVERTQGLLLYLNEELKSTSTSVFFYPLVHLRQILDFTQDVGIEHPAARR